MSKENLLWGRSANPWRAAEAEIRSGGVNSFEVHDRAPWTAIAELADNHADAIAAIDLCVVPTLTFERLFAFLVVGHGRRQLLWFAVTRNPSAQAGSTDGRGIPVERPAHALIRGP